MAGAEPRSLLPGALAGCEDGVWEGGRAWHTHIFTEQLDHPLPSSLSLTTLYLITHVADGGFKTRYLNLKVAWTGSTFNLYYLCFEWWTHIK